MVRVLVKAGQKGTGRLEVAVAPDKIMVNDGSVPEANIEQCVRCATPHLQSR